MKYLEEKQKLNRTRYIPNHKGHYESYFLRANHPTQPCAFWIRYTIFAPKNKYKPTLGELWAIYFDRMKGITALKQEFPFEQCQFSHDELNVSMNNGAATLTSGQLIGQIQNENKQIAWDLTYDGGQRPMLIVPENYLETSFPKAKVICANPNAVFSGVLTVNDERINIDGWVGSENHNWGSRHTDTYAWAQVAGFDNDPHAYLECATARIKVGPFKTPWLTPVVLRVQGQDYCLNGMTQSFKSQGRFELFKLLFDSKNKDVRIHGEVVGNREDFVGLTYYNPPGGTHTCLNSKLSKARVILERKGHPPLELRTEHRAALEIISPRKDHGVNIAV